MWQKNVRYLDYNATSGLSVSVREKLAELIKRPEVLANPSSRHRAGQSARKILYDASLQIAKSLGDGNSTPVSPDDLIFTSSGTEANQSVLRSIAQKTSLLLIGSGEHSSSQDFAKKNPQLKILEVPLLSSGEYDFSTLREILAQAKREGSTHVGLSLTLANNETGVLLDQNALREILKVSGLQMLVHFDGAQAWGKIPLAVSESTANYVTFSSHKIGAPSGLGLIWRRKDAFFDPLIFGTQAHGLRGGSENLIGIAATGFAAQSLDPLQFGVHTRPLVERLETGLKKLNHPIHIWGAESLRVPNTSRFSILQFKTYENWVELLDLQGFAVSHGSACKAQIIEPSHVLLKMGANHEDALNSLRVSFGPENTVQDVDLFLEVFESILAQKAKV